MNMPAKPRIVIVGGGFAGIATAKALRHCDADITIIDRRNHHIFQPLLYQVATAVLAPSDVAAPIRQLAAKQKNVSVTLAEVVAVDLKSRSVDAEYPGLGVRKIDFDYLVIAAGTQSSYFGHNEFAKYAPCLKTMTDAEAIRTKILTAYELAESTDDTDERQRQMTFVLVGAGPTGVELAASIAQMTTTTLRSNFRRIDPARTSIFLLEGGKRVLPSFAESLSEKAAKHLAKLGVKVITGAMVEHIDDRGVIVGGKRIESGTVLWTAGVSPSPLVKMLGVPTDRAGRACVGPLLNVPDIPWLFVIGDTATVMQDGRPLPGVAQVAIQQGRYVGRLITWLLSGGGAPRPFRYFNKGNMAVIGKNYAIMESGRIRLAGLTAWLIWAFIHLMFLPQLQNRRRVQNQWLWSYFTGQRSSRLVAEATRVVT
ncbi:MAG: NAD(P)/FAD-dependent oxidoreductase [Gammaproteobacteria bacterium]|nr:NAD(P)/FAD-dependent oxidoreductase [Gammaproteobacteria bacterium]